jgi:hypothetical protein
MRAWLPALLVLPAALTACPALLSDWTIDGGPTDDASADALGHDAAGGSSSGPSGSLDASIDADAGPAPEEAAAPDSGPDAGESGLSDSGRNDSGPADAGPCDGGPLVSHSNGVGQTWQDCVPLDTYNAAQALEACEAYAASVDAAVTSCALPPGTCASSSLFDSLKGDGTTPYVWTYDGQTIPTGTGRVANALAATSTGGCPSAEDPAWH